MKRCMSFALVLLITLTAAGQAFGAEGENSRRKMARCLVVGSVACLALSAKAFQFAGNLLNTNPSKAEFAAAIVGGTLFGGAWGMLGCAAALPKGGKRSAVEFFVYGPFVVVKDGGKWAVTSIGRWLGLQGATGEEAKQS